MVVRLLLSGFGTLALDQGTFIAWSISLVKEGFRNFYDGWSDYLPGYLYILWLLGKIKALNILPDVLLYKLPAIISDLFAGYLIYRVVSKLKSEKWGIIASSIYLFNPAVFANSSLWGQADSLTALFSLLSIYFFPSHSLLSAVFLAVGALIKPQAAFIAPVVLFLMLKEKWKTQKILAYLLIGLFIFVASFIPFWNHGSLFSFIYERLGISLNQYPYTSVNAFNFWGIFGFWKPDKLYFQIFGFLVVLASFLYLSFKLWKKENSKYLLLSFVFASTFVFFTRMHERHLLPVLTPLAIVVIENPILLIPYVGFSLTYMANLYYSYRWVTYDFTQVFPDIILKFLSFLNLGFAVFIFYALAKKISLKWRKVSSFGGIQQVALPAVKLSSRGRKILFLVVVTFAFATRVFQLGSPPSEYFDEVYHAFTAKVILHGGVEAWEWWNTPPEGFAFEWTHPPLAKLGMVLGMKIFGENSFGWRIPGALLGVGSVILVMGIAKLLFRDDALALLSGAVFSLDGLPLVMSRIGMNDSYLLFFVLLTVYYFLKEKDLAAALFFGFALASKWSAIWAIPILGILWLRRRKKFTPGVLWFFVLPFSVYLLSYLPMFLTGHDLAVWWGMQKQMWWYHTGLRATHPYTSPWWSWPLLMRPIYLYTSNEIGGTVSRIYAMGNPLVFWFGLVSVFLCLMYAYLERNKNLGLVVFSYLIFFVPWAASPRIMFLYHYLPSIPFLAIATAYVLRRNSKLITYYLLLITLVFIYFYPHWAGLQIPLWLDRSYYWMTSWR